MPSMRSAAELNAPITASDAALARSDATSRASCKEAMSSSRQTHLLYRLRQLVSHHQRGHHRETRVADLTELASQTDDALVDVLGELLQVLFLSVFASEAELATGDGGVDLSHGLLVHVQHRLDCRNRAVQSFRNFPVGRFESA